jgi:hypothetical protein
MAYTKADWWHTDAKGRRIGWLYPEDMEAILESFYGPRKWVMAFADQFGFARSTVDRWRDGSTPIPKHVAQCIEMLSAFKVRNLPLTTVEAPWLPAVEGSNARAVESD